MKYIIYCTNVCNNSILKNASTKHTQANHKTVLERELCVH